MENIPLPQKIEIKELEKNKALIIIEPCYPGYGTTLGSALRRVLLSSLSGAAVIAVKIKGASHEFTTLPKIKEDILEIILNLKQLRMRVFGDEPQILNLKVKGEKKVKANDIEKNSLVEIVNPELEICSLTDKKAELEMKIFVAQGRGYVPVEERKKGEFEVGTIAVDAIFTPLRKVGIDIENIRVGDKTDYDRLSLEIETDGIITPKEALEKAAKILVNQFNFLTGKEEKTEEIKEEKEDYTLPKEEKKKRGRPKKTK